MTKFSFSKIESILEETFRKMFIERIGELATIASLINDPIARTTPGEIQEIIERFQKELQKLKIKDKKLLLKLELSEDDEKRFMQPSNKYTAEDWLNLRELKERISVLKLELFGEQVTNPKDEEYIADQRKKHINKRYNVRDHWLPLH